jgi:hypothetical protein
MKASNFRERLEKNRNIAGQKEQVRHFLCKAVQQVVVVK